jgi:HAD superfamily phosphatase
MIPTSAPSAIVVFDIDGVVRDVGSSYRRAIADTVEHFTHNAYRPSGEDLDRLKSEGIWNNDWEASQELVYRYFAAQGHQRSQISLSYNTLVDFFQSRYRGANWDGYICSEPLLLQQSYLAELTNAGMRWGFFSGAPRDEAMYVLSRLGLRSPVLVGMEDAPGKPDPTGLFATVRQLEAAGEIQNPQNAPVIYVGDTVADMYVVNKARNSQDNRTWVAVGILPPHVQATPERRDTYTATLQQAGAAVVLDNVQELTPAKIVQWHNLH